MTDKIVPAPAMACLHLPFLKSLFLKCCSLSSACIEMQTTSNFHDYSRQLQPWKLLETWTPTFLHFLGAENPGNPGHPLKNLDTHFL